MNAAPSNRDHRGLSFWHESLSDSLDARTRLEGDTRADVVIVGAGYTGLWTAYYLKQAIPTLDIVLLEAEIAGFGASGRNGGWCSSYLSGIDHWLAQPQLRDSAIRLQRQMFDTVSEVGRVCEDEGIDCHFEQSGTLEIAVNRGQVRRLRTSLAQHQKLGFGEQDYRWLEPAELGSHLVVDGALGAVHARHTAAIHPARLARGLADILERGGVRIYENSPVSEVGKGWVATNQGKVKADSIVVATEGYTDSLKTFKRRLIPVHSMMVATEPLDDGQMEQLRFDRRYTFGNLDHLVTYGQLTADRRIAFGCRGGYEFGSALRRFQADDDEFEIVRKTLLRFFPGLDGIGFTHAWGGAMGVRRSLRPAVVFDRAGGVGWAGGYFGNGVAAANLAGRTLADLIGGRDTERTGMPWVSPKDARRRWEPEPLRWLGFRARRFMMYLADRWEYARS